MKAIVKMPKLGQTVDDVLVVEWHCSVGDSIQAQDTLMTVETDKADADVPSPVDGIVVELLVNPGDEVATGTPICLLQRGGGA